jgi:hypothetical protein
MVQDAGCRGSGLFSGFYITGTGFRIQGLGFWVHGLTGIGVGGEARTV